MTLQEGTFMTHFNNNVGKIKEIIVDPAKLYHHFDTLKNTHLTLENLIKQFCETSEKIVKNEVYQQMLIASKTYQTSWKQDIVSLVPDTYYQLMPIPTLNAVAPELYTDDVYDDLLQLVNLNADPNNPKDKKHAGKYKAKVVEIFNELSALKTDIDKFEAAVINHRDELTKHCTVALDQIYKSHMSFMKFKTLKSTKKVNVLFNDEAIVVEGKQTEVIPMILKKYLNLE